MTRNTFLALAILSTFGTVACKGTKEIDDPNLQASGKAVGASSSTLAATPADADDATVQANMQGVGTSLSSLVSQHQTYAATNSADVGGAAFETLARAEGDVIEWDGTHMLIDLTLDESGFAYTYNLDFTFGTAPSTLDGTYDLDYGLDLGGVTSTYNLSAVFDGLTFDDAGCTTSGTVSIDYSYKAAVVGIAIPGASSSSTKGTVITEFTACDTVVISGT